MMFLAFFQHGVTHYLLFFGIMQQLSFAWWVFDLQHIIVNADLFSCLVKFKFLNIDIFNKINTKQTRHILILRYISLKCSFLFQMPVIFIKKNKAVMLKNILYSLTCWQRTFNFTDRWVEQFDLTARCVYGTEHKCINSQIENYNEKNCTTVKSV